MLGAKQAGIGKLLPGCLHFINGFDLFAIKVRFLLISFGIMRRKIISRDTFCRFQNTVESIFIMILIALQFSQRFKFEYVIKLEMQIFIINQLGHGTILNVQSLR